MLHAMTDEPLSPRVAPLMLCVVMASRTARPDIVLLLTNSGCTLARGWGILLQLEDAQRLKRLKRAFEMSICNRIYLS